MNIKDNFTLIGSLVIAIGAGAIALGYNHFFKAKHDNIVEETAEKIIKDQTGVDMDLTPTTTEESVIE